MYFTSEHDKAIADYVASDNQEERNRIYESLILPVFKKLVINVINTFKYTSLPNINNLREDCVVHLTTVLNKFDPERHSTGFSYFTVIAKNFFNAASKKSSTNLQREVSYECSVSELEYVLVEYNSYDEERERSEFMYFLRKEIDTWDRGRKKNYLNDDDYKVLQAIKVLLDNSENIEIFNKKAIYLYLRNISNISTKHISRSLKKFVVRYQTFKKEWDEGIIDEQRYLE